MFDGHARLGRQMLFELAKRDLRRRQSERVPARLPLSFPLSEVIRGSEPTFPGPIEPRASPCRPAESSCFSTTS